MKKLFFALLFLQAILITNSQESKITIVDSTSNKPISYATIHYLENRSGTYTNVEGVFLTDIINSPIRISHVGYYSRTIKLPIKDDIIRLEPQTYFLNEITIKPVKNKSIEIGYYKFKRDFTVTGISGNELAVYFLNNSGEEKQIEELIIGFSTKDYIKSSLGINFVSIFRINFYSKKENSSEPDSLILKNDLLFTSDIVKPKTVFDLSKFNLTIPSDGIFVSIEWVGIESKDTKSLKTDYTGRTEPFISTTFDKTDAIVYERNKFKEPNWKLIDKNNKFSFVLKRDNYYTPRISLLLN